MKVAAWLIENLGSKLAADTALDELRRIPASAEPIGSLVEAVEIITDPTFDRLELDAPAFADLLREAEPRLYAAAPTELRFLVQSALHKAFDALLDRRAAAAAGARKAAQTLNVLLLERPDSWARDARERATNHTMSEAA